MAWKDDFTEQGSGLSISPDGRLRPSISLIFPSR
jgi:hypothetical protein